MDMFQAQEACGPLEIENALSVIRGLERDMQEAKASAGAGRLKPLPGETVRRSTDRDSKDALWSFFGLCAILPDKEYLGSDHTETTSVDRGWGHNWAVK